MDMREIFESGLGWKAWLDHQSNTKERLEERFKSYSLIETDIGYLQNLENEVHVLAIGESWCGDVVRQLPILAKMADRSQKIDLRIVGRDDWPDLMNRYLFNGAKVIPVFVFFSENFVEVGCWKGRPKQCRDQAMVRRNQ